MQIVRNRWIPVTERMPIEHDSIFAVHKGTDKWKDFMFEKESQKVIVTVVLSDGSRGTQIARTIDGKWKLDNFLFEDKEVKAWMPLPEPWEELSEMEESHDRE